MREPDEPAKPADIPSKLEHDLVNSLASIVGFSQVIRQDASLPADLRRNAELLAEEATRTRQMVGELLGLLRQRPAGLPGQAPGTVDPPASAAAASSAAADLEGTDTPSSSPTTRPSVLVLEDEPSMRVFLEKALALLGYDPVIASLAADAVPLATTGDYAVLLFDHQMAGMSGIDAVTAILAQRPDLAPRFVLMSGDVTDPTSRGLREHPVGLLAKPFDLDTLDRTIRAVDGGDRSVRAGRCRSRAPSSGRGVRRRRGRRGPAADAKCSSPRPSSRTRMIPRQTSRPMKSASSSGPIGWLSPTRAPASMSSAVPTPCSKARIASARNGIRIRLTMKPGRSADTMTCLPSSPARPRMASTVASSVVARPRMSSISGMTGTGLKKCMPTKRPRRSRRHGVGQPVDRDRARVRGEDRGRRRERDRARATARS